MSGVIKGVGKAFKKVGSVVKKIALPAAVLGLAVVTGGAALGIMPAIAGAGGLGASIGLSAGLSSALGAAGTGALIGGGMSAVTGGNVIKGATMGAITAGALNGVGQGINALRTAGTTASGAVTGTTGASTSGLGSLTNASTSLTPISDPSRLAATAMKGAVNVAPMSDVSRLAFTGSGLGSVTGGSVASAASSAIPTVAQATRSVASVLPSAASSAAPTAVQATGSGLGRFLATNQQLVASTIGGIGTAMSAKAAAKAEARAEQEAQQEIENNYNTDGFYGYGAPTRQTSSPYSANAAQSARTRWSIDPITGKPFREVVQQRNA